jgi:hypothetical protein
MSFSEENDSIEATDMLLRIATVAMPLLLLLRLPKPLLLRPLEASNPAALPACRCCSRPGDSGGVALLLLLIPLPSAAAAAAAAAAEDGGSGAAG